MSSSSNWKVHDLGASRKGLRHWWMQRISALALMPLSAWLVFSLASLPDIDYQTLVSWVADSGHGIFLISFLLSAYYHGMLGLQTILEDYVHTEWLRISSIICSNLFLLMMMVASIVSVLKIAFLH
ncbi:MAG TPA: succinate dehydrogenase, hydrophobic membrane anchor protein [Crenotrichaceae bacterium]|nr:succinate dehydrogenase, hydrophobic membrane anchor protein [Crenotrichaceae bacterium]